MDPSFKSLNSARVYGHSIVATAVAITLTAGSVWRTAIADTHDKHKSVPDSVDFAIGAPATPSEEWTLAAGGRLYDNWWDAVDKDDPKGTHPAYPAVGQQKGSITFRCKECHGWDYRGKDGIYGSGSHATGIIGIRGAVGREPAAIARQLRSAPHNYSAAMIDDASLARLAAFVSRGQHDTRTVIDEKTKKSLGSAERGKAVFQTVCAACHGFDGKLLNWGSEKEPEYVGTAANKFPEEFLHKVRNGHPGAIMINLRAFALEVAADVHAYAQTLPVK